MIDKNMKTDCVKYMARIVCEAATPLAIGSGEKDIFSDALVASTSNGLPYIPGTSIAGVLRHLLNSHNEINELLLGTQSCGSATVISDAMIIDGKGRVCDGLQLGWADDTLLACYQELPIRDHARIGDKGVTVDKGKFDNKVVYKGTRFCFEIELTLRRDDEAELTKYEERFKYMLRLLSSKIFRIGSGTRCGYGELKLVDDACKVAVLKLKEENHLDAYLHKSASLSDLSFWRNDFVMPLTQFAFAAESSVDIKYIHYQLNLKPLNFFLFGSGGGDADADMVPITEKCVVWNALHEGKMSEPQILIPATSVKGAIAHRVAYHYNLLNENFIGEVDREEVIGSANKAVACLFGCDESVGMSRGNVLFSDLFLNKASGNEKILNHVTIDPFTGGAMSGHLFSEKVDYYSDSLVMDIVVKEETFSVDDDGEAIQAAFENTLKDICNGMLPLGGGVNRGNGCFMGSLLKNGVELNLNGQYGN